MYSLQKQTKTIVDLLQKLSPESELNSWFLEIVEDGTGKEFRLEDNKQWTAVTRPILEAFFHARFFLEMGLRYGSLESPPQILPSGLRGASILVRLEVTRGCRRQPYFS